MGLTGFGLSPAAAGPDDVVAAGLPVAPAVDNYISEREREKERDSERQREKHCLHHIWSLILALSYFFQGLKAKNGQNAEWVRIQRHGDSKMSCCVEK